MVKEDFRAQEFMQEIYKTTLKICSKLGKCETKLLIIVKNQLWRNVTCIQDSYCLLLIYTALSLYG